MSTDPKNQHYLPRFYLKGYSNPDAPGLLYVYKKGSSHWMKRGIKNIASQDYLHSFRDTTGMMRHEIEIMFSQLEANFSPVLGKVLAGQTLSYDEEFTLSCFLMTTWQRVPEQVTHLNNFVSGMGQDLLEVSYRLYTQNPEALELVKAEYKRETGKDALYSLKPEDLDPSKLRIEANRNMTLTVMIEEAISLSEIIQQMGWAFLKSASPNYFITSDSPFCLITPGNDKTIYKNGLAYHNAEVSMPLSRNIAFFAGWKMKGRRWLRASESVVEKINCRTACLASRELIAPKRIFPGSEKILANFS